MSFQVLVCAKGSQFGNPGQLFCRLPLCRVAKALFAKSAGGVFVNARYSCGV